MFQNPGSTITFPIGGGGSGGGGTGTLTSTAEITAYSGGGQANATVTTAFMNYVTVGAANDSVLMLDAIINTTQKFINLSSSNNLAIYPKSGQQFLGKAVNQPYILGPNSTVQFTCAETGIFR